VEDVQPVQPPVPPSVPAAEETGLPVEDVQPVQPPVPPSVPATEETCLPVQDVQPGQAPVPPSVPAAEETGLPVEDVQPVPTGKLSTVVEDVQLVQPSVPPSLLARLPFSTKEHQMLKEACSAVGVTPRSMKRIVNVFKVMKIIWHRREQIPNYKLKRACVWLLVLSASRNNEVRLRISEVFEMLEKSLQIPDEPNLETIMAAVKITESYGDLFNVVFREVTWETEDEWSAVKAHFQIVRSFSFLGSSIPSPKKVHNVNHLIVESCGD
jgi:hypothetical protein